MLGESPWSVENISDNPARYVALMVHYLESQGMDCRGALQAAGIDRARLDHSQALLSGAQITSAVRQLALASQRTDLGFIIGGLIGPGLFGDLGRALLSCATLRDAIEISARYFALVTPRFSMRTREVGDRLKICWQPVQPVPYDLMSAAFEIILVSFHRQIERLVPGGLPPYDIHLSMSAPPHAERYRELKPARCHFGQGGLPALRIEIEAQVLNIPMPLVNAADLAEAEQRLQPRLHIQPKQESWVAWVRMMLNEALDCQPTQEALAGLVNLSTSTLARHLLSEGCHFRDLANESRHERACHWLGEDGVTVSEIARRLGYTSVANFSRAFRARSGVSPRAFALGQRRART